MDLAPRQKSEIDMGDLASGLYYLQINHNNKVQSFKVLKI